MILNSKQQYELLKLKSIKRLNDKQLGEVLNLNHGTLKRVLDSEAPISVSTKTYTVVNNFLLEELSKHD
ncbi:hypothetical protein [Weissella paramesenteroides]|uniref:hypothetical protein n=1 Tax=Weissella paramesenteroides TaxID=1249 RepID=UPI00223AF2B9|nr:hypothetical protein [Weissella paramesenteroides]MCT0485293.1 hypothetical protein [Weissella paramesenteroides]